jgi:hypothetical protein
MAIMGFMAGIMPTAAGIPGSAVVIPGTAAGIPGTAAGIPGIVPGVPPAIAGTMPGGKAGGAAEVNDGAAEVSSFFFLAIVVSLAPGERNSPQNRRSIDWGLRKVKHMNRCFRPRELHASVARIAGDRGGSR